MKKILTLKCFLAAVGLLGIGILGYFIVMFTGPHMNVQLHIRAYERPMPLPPKGMVAVEPEGYAVPTRERGDGSTNPIPDTQENRERGRVYYSYYCVFCHGENGQGDGPVGYSYMPAPTDLHDPKVVAMSDPDLLRGMLLGIGHEPVLSRVVLPQHRWYLVRYVRTLGRTPRIAAENQGRQVIVKDGIVK